MLRLFLIALLSLSCTAKERGNSELPDNNFSKFLDCFQFKELPLIIDRESLFDFNKQIYDTTSLAYTNNHFQSLKPNYVNFLPINLKDELPNLRCVYKFKTSFGVSIIIAKDLIIDREQQGLELFLLNYNYSSNLIDTLELCSYKLDQIESFVKIDQSFSIAKFSYIFQECPNNISNNENYICAQEIKANFKVNEKGKVIKLSETTRNGFFVGDGQGFHFVK